MMNRIAIILGATGLTGNALVEQLLDDAAFTAIKVFVRRTTGLKHPKLTEYIIHFDQPETWVHLVKGDVLFSALGTTLKKAGSKQNQYTIDYTYQYEFAKAAAMNGVSEYVLVSSQGADVNSRIFYLKMKGKLEADIAQLNFSHIHIMQPGPLDGNRKENRPAEKWGISSLKLFNKLGLLLNYRPIHVNILSKAMIKTAFSKQQKITVYKPKQIFELAKA